MGKKCNVETQKILEQSTAGRFDVNDFGKFAEDVEKLSCSAVQSKESLSLTSYHHCCYN